MKIKNNAPFILIAPIVIAAILLLFYVFSSSDAHVFSNKFVWVVLVLALIVVYIATDINTMISNKEYAKLSPEDKIKFKQEQKEPYLQRLIKSAYKKQDDKEENTIILDHGFDGIKELDNALPNWWLSLFYFGTIFMILYVLAYFTTDFAHLDAEFAKQSEDYTEMVAEIEKRVPQATLETAVYNPNKIAEGKELFKKNCATCHKENGAGGIGPNLTDDHWINIKQQDLYKNVFYMVYNGSENNKTMRAFGKKGEIKGNSIQSIASYVYSINQDQPNAPDGASPQGEKVDWNGKVITN
jgi:cytochrome c oxidase cbb3-type subunit III